MQADLIDIDTSESRIKRLRQAVLTRARILQHTHAKNLQAWMFTLTYAELDQWSPKHITAFVNAFREWGRRRKILSLPYVWVAELQKRGAVHYHVLVWLPKRFREANVPKPDLRGWWKWGLTQRERARNAVGYLAKYVSKGSLSSGMKFPKGCRLHGAGVVSQRVRISARWWLLPSWVRNACFPADDVVRRAGGGFVSRVTGEVWSSIYGLVLRQPGRVTVRQILPAPPLRQVHPSTSPLWLEALRGLDGFSH